MAKIKMNKEPINTIGSLPEKGTKAPDFILTNSELQDITLDDFKDITSIKANTSLSYSPFILLYPL